MRASVTHTQLASEKANEEAKVLNKWVEDSGYQFLVNWYANPVISAEADKFVEDAKRKLDASMKGWTPQSDDTLYSIHHNGTSIEYSYTRAYTK